MNPENIFLKEALSNNPQKTVDSKNGGLQIQYLSTLYGIHGMELNLELPLK